MHAIGHRWAATIIQLALDVALNGHDAGGSIVVTTVWPEPPLAPKDWLVGEMEKPQEEEKVGVTDPELSE